MATKGIKRGATPPVAAKPAATVESVKPVAATKVATTKAEPVKLPATPVAAAPPVVPTPVKAEAPKPVAAKPVVTVPAVVAPVAAVAKKIVEETKTVIEAAPAKVADVITTATKDIKIMATNFETTAPKPAAVLGEINDRAKAAMEKSSKMVEDMTDFAKGNVEAIVESSRITAKGLETLGQDAAEYSRKSFENMTAAMKSFASAKSPTEFFKLQSDFVRQSFDQAVAEASKGTEAMMKLSSEAAQPISNRVAIAAEKIKIAA